MPGTSVHTLDMSPVGRVEADLDVRVDTAGGHVVDVWTWAGLFHRLEVTLRDRDPRACVVVTPRACGICSAFHPISDRPLYTLFGGQWRHSSCVVPGGVMCAPTLTDVTRVRGLLEYFPRSGLEPSWLACSLERYEQIRSYDDFMAWLDDQPEHASLDLVLFWRTSYELGLDSYGRGPARSRSSGSLARRLIGSGPSGHACDVRTGAQPATFRTA